MNDLKEGKPKRMLAVSELAEAELTDVTSDMEMPEPVVGPVRKVVKPPIKVVPPPKKDPIKEAGGEKPPKKEGTTAPGSTGGVKKVISTANRFVLENFVAPLAVGYALNVLTGEQRLVHPQGSQSNPDGTVAYPNGSVANPDNTITHTDGSVTEADGKTVTYPDGRTFNLSTGLMTFTDGTTAQGVKQGGEWLFPADE